MQRPSFLKTLWMCLVACTLLRTVGGTIDDEIIPGKYIVTMNKSRTGSLSSVGVAQAFGISSSSISTLSSRMGMFSADLSADEFKRLSRRIDVYDIEPVKVVRAFQGPSISQLWGLDRSDQESRPLSSSYTLPTDSNGNQINGTGVHVYILDTGVDYLHQEFKGKTGVGADFVQEGTGSYDDDCQGHGTHCAGTAAGYYAGIAPGATVHSLKVLSCSGSGSTSGIIAALNWMMNNAERPAIASMSLGGGKSTSFNNAVNAASADGIVVVAAAGNENQDANNVSPASASDAITVGASTSWDARASFSNWGTALDIFAPGQSIRSARYGNGQGESNGYTSMSGTSMACPHVAGAAALYLQTSSAATASAVRDALVAAASTNKLSDVSGSVNKLLNVANVAYPVQATTTTTTTTTTTANITTTTTTTGETCYDLAGFVDSYGLDCSYYELTNGSECADSESFANENGEHANMACCVCGGGSAEESQTTTTTQAASRGYQTSATNFGIFGSLVALSFFVSSS